ISAYEDTSIGEDEINLNFEYCTDLFKMETMERLSTHYVNILRKITDNPEVKLTEIEILIDMERKQLLDEFNDTNLGYEKEKTLHELFIEQVDRTPAKVALVFNDEKLIYGELNTKTNQLAHLLREYGVARDEIIGIMADRSIEMIIGILAVLKAGGAYLPVDPDYPIERIEYMLEDSDARILLTHNDTAENVAYDGIVIDLQDSDLYTGNGQNLENINTPADLAYVMYTSGSTGKPKGVMIEHRSVVNLSNYYNEIFTLKNKNIVHMSNVSFDTSVVEIFPPLMYGASVYVIRKELALDSKKFIKFVEDNQINIAQFVPMTLKEILAQNEKIESLEAIIVGGDKLEDTLKDEILSLGYKLTNHYGPTECTVDATVARCEKSKSSIGMPIANTRAYILDKDNNPTPIGVPGELCIAGDGLARGYLNRPELTTAKFVHNPFLPDEKMYRTGDLASWQPDGNITFLGRIDNQVKIRGYRIEIGEIESQLLKHEDIKEAVVVDKMDQNGLKYLSAYIVSDDEVTMAKMRVHLSTELPDYMIPSYFMQIDKIPYTNNGKVDRKVLPEPDGSVQTGVEYVAPTNKIEQKLVEIWQEVLRVEHLGLNHNFFEVGGHSLKATVLVSKIHKKLNVEVPLGEIFKKPTIKELAEYIQKAEENIYTSISPVEEADYYPVSSSQKRIFIQWQLDEQSTAYNMPAAIILEGELDLQKLEQAINELIERHEALRTSFELVNSEPVQKIHKKIDININYRETKEENLKDLAEQFIKPFDLSKAPLLRVTLIKFEAKKYLLLFDMHHIISDGVSLSIVIRDFEHLYQGKNMPQLRIQYKDYASWHNSLMESEIMEKMGKYWIEKMNNFTYTELPARSSDKENEGKRTQLVLDESITKRIDEFCKKHKVTKFAFVLAIFKLIIMKTINQKDITIGISVAGRRDEELENILGVFLNLLVIRTQIQKDAEFKEHLYNVRDNLMEAQEYQDYPYEHLYAKLKEELNFKENSLFSILFNYMPYQESNNEITLNEFTVKPYQIEEAQPKYGLTLYVNEGKDRMFLSAVFQSKLGESVIEHILNSFKDVIEVVLDNEDILINQISLAEKENQEEMFSQEFDVEFDDLEFF
ncbi:MAG: amino acid adenylation domain-containing protein, partial [Halanaerobiales bacterium]|nr:amino acid adenylation domain-containing protein [Halanaerobiales bacterium]